MPARGSRQRLDVVERQVARHNGDRKMYELRRDHGFGMIPPEVCPGVDKSWPPLRLPLAVAPEFGKCTNATKRLAHEASHLAIRTYDDVFAPSRLSD